jgi:hypothetical protein
MRIVLAAPRQLLDAYPLSYRSAGAKSSKKSVKTEEL